MNSLHLVFSKCLKEKKELAEAMHAWTNLGIKVVMMVLVSAACEAVASVFCPGSTQTPLLKGRPASRMHFLYHLLRLAAFGTVNPV